MKYRRMAQTTTTTAANRLNFIYAHFYLLSICKRAHVQLKFHSAETNFFFYFKLNQFEDFISSDYLRKKDEKKICMRANRFKSIVWHKSNEKKTVLSCEKYGRVSSETFMQTKDKKLLCVI